MRISDWSSDVCSSDLADVESAIALAGEVPAISVIGGAEIFALFLPLATRIELTEVQVEAAGDTVMPPFSPAMWRETAREAHAPEAGRSEEHTSELQSLMHISSAVFCLNKKKPQILKQQLTS